MAQITNAQRHQIAYLGAVLLEAPGYRDSVMRLSPAMFEPGILEDVFSAVYRLVFAGKGVDPITVADQAADAQNAEEIRQAIFRWAETCPSVSHLEDYEALLYEDYRQRLLAETLAKLQTAQLSADADGSHAAATAIMTTDTHPKEYALAFEVNGTTCHIGAIAKGSGMIHPNMATMLLFMTTDVKIAPALLQKALSAVVPATFNQISVDGDTSTNDTVLLLASGLSGAEITENTPAYDTFMQALTAVAEHLCRELAADGEGATKLLECTVTGAPDVATARAVSKSVIHSTLFKAAMFGADANWGRVLCAIGYTPGDFDISKTAVRLRSKAGEVFVCENAAYHPYSEDEAAVVLQENEIEILVDLGCGSCTAKAWGCDLTYDYVKINGDYRT